MKIQDILSEHNTINEITASEMLERQKGFPYQLKKKGSKHYIFYLGKNKKAYFKGVKNLNKLKEIVKPWLENSSLTYKKWSPKLRIKLINKYIERLKKTLEE